MPLRNVKKYLLARFRDSSGGPEGERTVKTVRCIEMHPVEQVAASTNAGEHENRQGDDGPRGIENFLSITISDATDRKEELDGILTANDPEIYLSYPPKSAFVGFRQASALCDFPGGDVWCILEEIHYIGSFRRKWPVETYFLPESCTAFMTRAVQLCKNESGKWSGETRCRFGLCTVVTRTISIVVILQKSQTPNLQRWRGVNEKHIEASDPGNPFTHRLIYELTKLAPLYTDIGLEKPQVLLLLLHHAHLNLMAIAVSNWLGFHLDYRLKLLHGLLNTRLSDWNSTALSSDMLDADELRDGGDRIANTTESLLEVVTALMAAGNHDQQLRVIAADIRGSSRQISTRFKTIDATIATNLQQLDLQRDLRQSSNLRVLTFLATVFLPLSLATGVLSMNTRFRDLGLLLYDFFCVVILSAAIGLITIATFHL